MNSVISTAHLSKKFLSSEAIHDLTFEVPEASIFGYLGPNGAGSSSTFHKGKSSSNARAA